MGRLSGFNYRQITQCLKTFGFAFDRQAAGSHEIWHNEKTNRYTTIAKQAGIEPDDFLRKNNLLKPPPDKAL